MRGSMVTGQDERSLGRSEGQWWRNQWICKLKPLRGIGDTAALNKNRSKKVNLYCPGVTTQILASHIVI